MSIWAEWLISREYGSLEASGLLAHMTCRACCKHGHLETQEGPGAPSLSPAL